VEALARWNSPFRGSVSPGIFIPVAEASGLILPLGHWVFEAGLPPGGALESSGTAAAGSHRRQRQRRAGAPAGLRAMHLDTLKATGADPATSSWS
jgi:hypothetical protein